MEDFGDVVVEEGLGSLGVAGTYGFAGGVEWFIVELSLLVWLGMVGVRNNLLVIRWLISGHPVFGGLGFRAIPGGVCAVFTMKQVVKPSQLLGPASASSFDVGVAVLLCGVLLTTSCVSGVVFVGDDVYLLLVAV